MCASYLMLTPAHVGAETGNQRGSYSCPRSETEESASYPRPGAV